ncbi:aminotransferase class I/II-fold pyridoxal phosphate-dependent enzyme [Rhizobium sp. CRIBSB]|nr:aminotransferase class I/II-fold pyridoxal phosphate-dependent enzyme [Rhizobium sp. CRIBSB]
MKISQLPSTEDTTWSRVFDAVDRGGAPLHIQIRRMIVRGTETGTLPAETRLPSSRHLASMLGVGRNTVTSAYQQLIDEGFLVSHHRSGIFVSADIRPAPMKTRQKRCANLGEKFVIRPSRLHHITKPRDWRSYPYPFLSGQYDPALFPTNNWREAVRATSTVQEIQGWAADMIDDDDPDLIEQLRLQVLPRRGIFVQPDEIIITIGSQQALAMIVQLFIDRETPVGLENPGYPDLRNMVSLATRNARFLTSDHQGVVPDRILSECQIAFVTVGHQCPTTAVMPEERRKLLLKAATRSDLLLVEDDYDADLSVEVDRDIPSLKSMDAAGRVIYVGSFSKVLAPGLRIGYLVATKPVIEELRVLRRLMLRHPPTNNQRSLATFIALGHYRQHLAQTGSMIAERARLIAETLPHVMPSCRWVRGAGSSSFWVEGPPQLDARLVVAIAKAQGILIEAGDIFYADQAEGRNCFRIGFSSIASSRIAGGLAKLGAIVEEQCRRAKDPWQC